MTKRSTAKANAEKRHLTSNSAAESASHPCHAAKACDNNTKTIPNNIVVLVVQLVSRHSCVADRLPVVVRFPAGPRVRLKTVDPLKGNGLGQKKQLQTTWCFDKDSQPCSFETFNQQPSPGSAIPLDLQKYCCL